MRGKVLRFYGAKGYGWIEVSDTRSSLFYHIKDTVTGALILHEDDLVEFDIGTTERGDRAVHVRLAATPNEGAGQ